MSGHLLELVEQKHGPADVEHHDPTEACLLYLEWLVATTRGQS